VVQSSLQSFFFPTFGAFQVWSPQSLDITCIILTCIMGINISDPPDGGFSRLIHVDLSEPGPRSKGRCWKIVGSPNGSCTDHDTRDLLHSEWRWLAAGCCWKRVLETLLANIGQLKKDKADKDTQFFPTLTCGVFVFSSVSAASPARPSSSSLTH
jgi:hypothetical protein